MLKVIDAHKKFGDKEAVKGVSFTVSKGETFGILGPNGAGKSTTISMICGLLTPTSGEIYVKGINVLKNPQEAKELMGVVPQDIALYPTLTARENLNFWGSMYGLSGKTLKNRVDETLELVSLSDRQKDRIDTFSGGMKRRINIAASLLHRPEMLIMDEPTVGIDPQSRNSILETIKHLNSEIGMTVLYTSHYMEEVEFLCTKVAIIDYGKVIALGSLDEVRQLAGGEATITLKVSSPDDEVLESVLAVSGVRQARIDGDAIVAMTGSAADALASLMTAIANRGRRVTGVVIEEPNLESVFLRLTGRALRD